MNVGGRDRVSTVVARGFDSYPWGIIVFLRTSTSWVQACNHIFSITGGNKGCYYTYSFLIGRKRTVNFRNQRRDIITADYTIIMSRTLKVTGYYVMYDF